MDSHDLWDWTQWGLLAIDLVLVAKICLPDLLQALGISMYRSGIEGGPSEVEPDGTDPRYENLHQQLVELGFRPLGVHWFRTLWETVEKDRAFTSENGDCTALLENPFGGEFQATFQTVFVRGFVVHTTTYPMDERDDRDWLATGIPTESLEDVLSCHRKAVASFLESGEVPHSCNTLEEFHQIEIIKFHNPGAQRFMRRAYASEFRRKASFLGLVPLVMAGVCWLAGWSFLFPEIALLVLCVLCLKLEKVALRYVDEEWAAQRQAHGP